MASRTITGLKPPRGTFFRPFVGQSASGDSRSVYATLPSHSATYGCVQPARCENLKHKSPCHHKNMLLNTFADQVCQRVQNCNSIVKLLATNVLNRLMPRHSCCGRATNGAIPIAVRAEMSRQSRICGLGKCTLQRWSQESTLARVASNGYVRIDSANERTATGNEPASAHHTTPEFRPPVCVRRRCEKSECRPHPTGLAQQY